MLHYLNSARVIAEFFVVHYHLRGDVGSHEGLVTTAMSADLMSFFFVLSGYVAMHSYSNPPYLHYLSRRLSKTYPIYLLWLLLDLPSALKGSCPYSWTTVLTQITLLSPWLGNFHLDSCNLVSWYIATLFWLWALFPPLVPFIKSCASWISILCLYVFSVTCFGFLTFLDPLHVRAVPLLRLAEFLMGAMGSLVCLANGWIVSWFLVIVLGYWLMNVEFLMLSDENKSCWIWRMGSWSPWRHEAYLSKTSIAWVMLLNWLARAEPRALCPFLSLEIFRLLSAFSLQLYLGHYVIGNFLITLSGDRKSTRLNSSH